MNKIIDLIKNKKIMVPTIVTVVLTGVVVAAVTLLKSGEETPELEDAE